MNQTEQISNLDKQEELVLSKVKNLKTHQELDEFVRKNILLFTQSPELKELVKKQRNYIVVTTETT
ncbi:MAG: hypothetical protein JXR58_10495 [Bacteroidales bacterium]|nr:hypothetical protein [Bacteroidales bacterium]